LPWSASRTALVEGGKEPPLVYQLSALQSSHTPETAYYRYAPTCSRQRRSKIL